MSHMPLRSHFSPCRLYVIHSPVYETTSPVHAPTATNTTKETDNTQQTTSFNAGTDPEYSTLYHKSMADQSAPAPKNAENDGTYSTLTSTDKPDSASVEASTV